MASSSEQNPKTDFASNCDDADDRAKQFIDHDPFPDVAPALLSSAEIEDYVRITGMLHPFRRQDLKSASYSVAADGRQFIWDDKGKQEKKILHADTPCCFPANSISFIELGQKLRLPHYIAARFNLTITHVHRGLLLGTGPLIDPGFEGRLLIPVHNLTDTDYTLPPDKALIWLEFTKTTYQQAGVHGAASFERRGKFKPFDPGKKNRTAEEYFHRANSTNPIRSSIPVAVVKSQKAAESAAQAARLYTFASLIAVLIGVGGVCVALLALHTQVQGIVHDAHSLNNQALDSLKGSITEIKAIQDKQQTAEQKLRDVESDYSKIQKATSDQLTGEITELRRQLEALRLEFQLLRNQAR